MAKDLNSLFGYNKLKPAIFRSFDIVTLRDNPIHSKDDWVLKDFTSLKRHIRAMHYKAQKRRCAFCRRILNPLGINEHIEHLVARSIIAGWMFKPRNLVLSCYQCNTQKSSKPIFERGRFYRRLPKKSSNYILFNPYVHKWSDHFEIEDEIFIKAKSQLGQDTINELKLYDYKYSIIYSTEANIFGKTAITRASLRLYSYPSTSIEYKSAKKLINEIMKHI